MPNILERLQQAIKAITTPDLGNAKLNPQQAERFIRAVSESTTMLNEARRLDMQSHTRLIDRIGFGSRILEKATENTDPSGENKPDFAQNELKSEELIAVVGVTDNTLEDNLERANFENTLVDLMGQRAGLDLEELFIQGDTDDGADTFLKTIDGWLEKAANEVQSTTDFDASDVEAMFDALIGATPKKYIRDRSQWRLYVTWDVEDAYRDILRGRGTTVGDSAQTTGQQLAYKGFPVRAVPNMPDGKALFSTPRNEVYGLYRDVRIEPERLPKKRRTDFILTLRADCHYEDENAATVATIA